MSDNEISNKKFNQIAEIQTKILKLLKGQTYSDAEEILNYALDSLKYNSIVEKEVL